MPWTRQQIQSFPCRELYHLRKQAMTERLDPRRRSQQTLQRWMQFIAPHTPSESDLASRGVLPDDIADVVYMLLSQISQEIHSTDIPDIKKMLDAWPTIWIWIRLLYGRGIQVRKRLTLLSEAQLVYERGMYMALVEVLLVFSGYNSRGKQSTSDELTTTVKGTDGVLRMMATLWIEEAKDEAGSMGYNSTRIFHGSLSTLRSEMEHLVISGCGGSTKEVAKIAFLRITHNFHRLRYQIHFQARESTAIYFYLGQDIVFVSDILDQPSSALHECIRAHSGWVKVFIDIISYLLPAPHQPAPHNSPERSNKAAVIITSMSAVTLYIGKVQAYRGLLELLESPFLEVVSKASFSGHKAMDMDQLDLFIGCCNDLIKKQICHGLVYRSVLCRTERGLRDTAITTWMRGNKAPMALTLLDLQSNSALLLEAYKAFRKGPPPIFCCGNKVCKSTDSGNGTLYRCHGCKLALYCGVDCQKQDWKDVHKLLCYAMKKPGQTLPFLSSPDLRWFAYLYVRELIQTPFFYSGSTVPDSTGNLTTLPVLRWGTETHFVDLTDQSAAVAAKILPSGRVREAWRRSLSPRQSGHNTFHPTGTVAALILLPPQVGTAHGSMTALLTFPMAEYVRLEEGGGGGGGGGEQLREVSERTKRKHLRGGGDKTKLWYRRATSLGYEKYMERRTRERVDRVRG